MPDCSDTDNMDWMWSLYLSVFVNCSIVDGDAAVSYYIKLAATLSTESYNSSYTETRVLGEWSGWYLWPDAFPEAVPLDESGFYVEGWGEPTCTIEWDE